MADSLHNAETEVGMKRRCIACLLVLGLLFGSSGASADPANWGHLGRIVLWLERIDSTLRDINGLVDDIKTRLADVYPDGALRQIETVFEPVDSIKDEVEKLACNWRFTPRVDRLRLALFAGGSFCRSEWDAVFGPPVDGVDADLESYYDWSAVRRINLIKTRNEKSAARAAEAHWLAEEAVRGRDPSDPTKPYSPGYAQRLSAIGAAQLGNVMVETGDTQTAMLELDQEALNDKRRRRWLDHAAADVIYLSLTREPRRPADTIAGAFGDRP
jgi:hypothetical protein